MRKLTTKNNNKSLPIVIGRTLVPHKLGIKKILKLSNLNDNNGVTLVEILVAITMIVIFLIGATTLFIHTYNLSVLTGHRLQATALAAEGLEISRNIRDTFWEGCYANTNLTSPNVPNTSRNPSCIEDQWYDSNGPANNSTPTGFIAYRNTQGISNKDFAFGSFHIPENPYDTWGSSSLVQQWRIVPCPGTPGACSYTLDGTTYTRRVDFENQTTNLAGESSLNDLIVVRSLVTWIEKGATRNVEMRQYLSKWKIQ